MAFGANVFVNCPFDSDYLPLLRPLLFTILELDFEPRIASEEIDSGTPRIEKILALILDSKCAIHDLPRIQAQASGEYYRLNMPFELGIDIGCRLFKRGRWSQKRCLILEAEKYRYQAAISDMSNSDIAVHGNDPRKVVSQVRNWLSNAGQLRAPGTERMWGRFNEFMADHYDVLATRGFSPQDIEDLSVAELIDGMREWLRGPR